MKHLPAHLFFDLDRTLWDFDKSALEALERILNEPHLKEKGLPDAEKFYSVYNKHNNILWEQYRDGKIEKELLRWFWVIED